MSRLTASGKPKIGLVQFPGSNCDMDCVDALQRHFGISLETIWHTETKLPQVDGVIVPGGFSFGDYLRSGALASHSQVMTALKDFAGRGGAVIGICNGFQILTESHLLPGVLLRNASQRFICEYTHLTVVASGESIYHQHLRDSVVKIPIAHGEGRYFIAPDGLRELYDHGQVLFQYSDAAGSIHDAVNPNGAVASIAGIVSRNGRVMGLMPHPERATDRLMGGSADGLKIWKAFLASFT